MKNEIIKMLCERRSVKSYTSEQVNEADLQEILKAATYTPTGHNSQSPVMVVLQNKEDIATLSKINAQVMNATCDPFYGAPTVVIVFGDPEKPTWKEDACLVAGNLMVGATAMGIGSCWINRAPESFATEEGKALMKKWGLRENLIGVANIIMGYQDQPAKPRVARKEDYIIRIK